MKVYKFGGASVKDASGVRNLKEIVACAGDDLMVVISAMGKTTNALERVVAALAQKSAYPLVLRGKCYPCVRV